MWRKIGAILCLGFKKPIDDLTVIHKIKERQKISKRKRLLFQKLWVYLHLLLN